MFLAHLLQRTLDGETAIRPRRVARFESAADPAIEEAMLVPAPAQRTAPPPPPTDPPTAMPSPAAPAAAPTLPDRRETGREQAASPEIKATIRTETSRVDTPPRRAEPAPPADPPRPAAVRKSKPAPVPPRRSDPARIDRGHVPPETPKRILVEHVTDRVETRTVEQRLAVLTRETLGEQPIPASTSERPASVAAAPFPARARIAPPQQAAPAPVGQRRPRQGPILPAVAAAEPMIEVRIGRVEMRTTTVAPPPRAPHPAPVSSKLEDYLRRRDGN